MAPIVHGLEAKYHGQINFAFLDVDDPLTEPFRKELGFRFQPAFYLLDAEGNVLKQWLGFVPAEEFEAEFAKALGDS
jgi:hypothetical protein